MIFFDVNWELVKIFGYSLSYVEFFGTSFGLISVYLATRQHILTWPTGIVNVVLFFTIFYQVQLYSDMFLQVYFLVTSIYGWFVWSSRKAAITPARFLTSGQKKMLVAILIVSTLLFGFFVRNIHHYFPHVFKHPAAYPFLDTFIATASIIANILLAKRFLENWTLWILLDLCCVYVYYQKNIVFISSEYLVFFFLALYGLINWKKTIKNDKRLSAG